MAGYYKNEVEMPDGAMVFFGQYHVLDGEPMMYTGPSMTVAEMKRDQRIGSLRYCNVGDRIKSDDEVARLRERAERAERYAAHLKAGLDAVVGWSETHVPSEVRDGLIALCRRTSGACFCGYHVRSTAMESAGLNAAPADEGSKP